MENERKRKGKEMNTRSDWAVFLAKRFRGSDYEATPAEYYGWCAGVEQNDTPEEVAQAWIDGWRDGRIVEA